MSATEQPHPEASAAPSMSLTDLDKWYEALIKLKPAPETLDQFLETAISYLQCLYHCYQSNAPQNLEKVKPFFEQVLLDIDGGIFKDTGAHAYENLLRTAELSDYLPDTYSNRLVLDQLHMLLHAFANGAELQDSTTSWLLRNTLGLLTRAEGSTWLPRTSILKRIPDQLLPILDGWHAVLGLQQEATATYNAMLTYRSLPEIRANFERQFAELQRKYDKNLADLSEQLQQLDRAHKAEAERVEKELSIKKKALEQASRALETQLQACITSMNQHTDADHKLRSDATLSDVTQLVSLILTQHQQTAETAMSERNHLLMGMIALLSEQRPDLILSERPTNAEALAALQSHLRLERDAPPILHILQRELGTQRASTSHQTDPSDSARLALQFQ